MAKTRQAGELDTAARLELVRQFRLVLKRFEGLRAATRQIANDAAGYDLVASSPFLQIELEIACIDSLIKERLEAVVTLFHSRLAELVGFSCDNFEQNQKLARMIQETAQKLGVLFVCTKEGCGRPGLFRCAKPAGSEKGDFQFEHVTEPRTTHKAGTTIPELKVVRKES